MQQCDGVRQGRGFTLIEVLVTVLVLSLGVLGLAGLHVATVRATQSAYFRSQAATLGYQITDAMRANRGAAVAGDYDTGFADDKLDCADPDPAQADLCLWKQAVAARLPAGAASVAVGAGNLATVCVRWAETERRETVASTDDACGDLPAGARVFELQTVL